MVKPTRKDINEKRAKFPFCVVWTPLPMISWLLPFIGHVGIASSDGKIHDFAGPYHVGVDDMAFGSPTKYWLLDDINDADHYDQAIAEADEIYSRRMHNLCCDNCHSHVAQAFNIMGYKGKREWTMVSVFWYLTKKSHYCRPLAGSAFRTYAGFIIIASIILSLSFGLGFGL
uniref:Transmembrane protein 222 n=1 Tax=Palpitomonas bilix TaxID=652834 RepID=A0A7S3GI38_9EUKA